MALSQQGMGVSAIGTSTLTWTHPSNSIAFTSGGTYVLRLGDTITGATSGATGVVRSFVITSGSFAGGDAAGTIYFSGKTGTFQSETLNVGANTDVATIGGDSTTMTPKGVVVGVVQSDTTTDEVTSITFGGTSMTEVSAGDGSPLVFTSTALEHNVVSVFFLGSSVPTGDATVSVTVSGSSEKVAYSFAVGADNDTSVLNAGHLTDDAAGANPSATLALSSTTAFVCQFFGSGTGSPNNVSPLSGWSQIYSDSDGADFGNNIAGAYVYSTIGTSDVTYGATQSADDFACIAVAIQEAAGASTILPLINAYYG